MNKDDSIRLTPREQEVMQWSADGKSCSDIGVILGISPYTVVFHRKNVCEKVGAVCIVQAVVECIRRGLIR